MIENKKKVIVSGVNLTEGGILSILYDFLKALKDKGSDYNWDAVFLVHDKNLVFDYLNDFTFIAYPEIKKSWFKRVKFEYWDCKSISKQMKPDIWIALHDITPNVDCPVQIVYCHNPAAFYKVEIKNLMLDYKFFLFGIFYKFLYGINIKRNSYVIIQQAWIRKWFKKQYDVDTVVAYPSFKNVNHEPIIDYKLFPDIDFSVPTFFYPSFPRTFKNFETLFKAGILLYSERKDFQIIVTIDGSQNKYAEKLIKTYGAYNFIKFIGKQSRENVNYLYSKTDCVIFPSNLETWGLPLSEAKQFNKPILAADLEYAHETIGEYPYVKFFDPHNPLALVKCITDFIDKNIVYDKNDMQRPLYPFFDNWPALIDFIDKIDTKK